MGVEIPEGLRVTLDDDVMPTRVVVQGELDAETSPILDAYLSERLGGNGIGLVVDLEGVSFIDSAGLSVLVSTHRKLAAAGAVLTVRTPSPAARRLFEISGLDKVLAIAED